MAHEIELKLSLDPADALRFMRHPLLRGARARSDEMLDNWYYDTPELALRQYGVALRVRRQGRKRLQTIKLASKLLGEAGLSMRPEWETPFSGVFDFSPVAPAATRAWLQRPEIAERIAPLFQTRFRRQTWHLPLAQGELLIALDRGVVRLPEPETDTAPICEVELELSDSEDVAAIRTVAERLAQRVRLEPSDISKAQRGYVLLGALPGRKGGR